jgi:hypothetical protein
LTITRLLHLALLGPSQWGTGIARKVVSGALTRSQWETELITGHREAIAADEGSGLGDAEGIRCPALPLNTGPGAGPATRAGGTSDGKAHAAPVAPPRRHQRLPEPRHPGAITNLEL